MRSPLLAAVLAAGLPALPASAQDRLAPGIWANTEDVYFAGEEGRTARKWSAIEVRADGMWREIDPFGTPQGDWREQPVPGVTRRDGGSGWQVLDSELRQARMFSCWVSVRKFAGKPDGSPDWTFVRGLETFDQGGRVFVPGQGDAPDVTFRLRNVTWAKGSRNRPALVLYVHTDDPDRAESYSWASPDAALIGINLRWVQGSCGLVQQKSDGA